MKRRQFRQKPKRRLRLASIIGIIIALIVLTAGGIYIYSSDVVQSPHRKTKVKVQQVTKQPKQPVSARQIKSLQQDVAPTDDLARHFDQQLQQHQYIGTALVVHNHRIILQKGYGYADAKTKRLNNAISLFQFASLQKSLTALMIMQQIEKGKLSLDTPVSKFYPKIPNANSITIKNLLTMTSGLKDSGTLKGMTLDERDVQQVIATAVIHQVPDSGPWAYRMIDYKILTGILRHVTRESYQLSIDDLSQQGVIGLTDYQHFIIDKNRTYSYRQNYQLVKDNPVAYSHETGTGNYATTTGMLYHYYDLLLNCKLLKPMFCQEMLTPLPNENYAAGLYNNGDYYSAHGIIRGYEPCVVLSKNSKDAVILLSNQNYKKNTWQPLAKRLFTEMTAIPTK